MAKMELAGNLALFKKNPGLNLKFKSGHAGFLETKFGRSHKCDDVLKLFSYKRMKNQKRIHTS